MPMDLFLTEHARDSMSKRQIPLAWVERVVVQPEWREDDRYDPELEHHLARIVENDGRVLRVVVNIHATPWRIITAFFDRRRTSP
jgi:hypothetical protein